MPNDEGKPVINAENNDMQSKREVGVTKRRALLLTMVCLALLGLVGACVGESESALVGEALAAKGGANLYADYADADSWLGTARGGSSLPLRAQALHQGRVWYLVDFQGQAAYVAAEDVLIEDAPISERQGVIARATVLGDRVNLRKSPSMSGEIAAVAEGDEVMEVVSESVTSGDTWYGVRRGGETLYVFGELVSVTRIDEAPTPAPTAAPTAAPSAAAKSALPTEELRLEESAAPRSDAPAASPSPAPMSETDSALLDALENIWG